MLKSVGWIIIIEQLFNKNNFTRSFLVTKSWDYFCRYLFELLYLLLYGKRTLYSQQFIVSHTFCSFVNTDADWKSNVFYFIPSKARSLRINLSLLYLTSWILPSLLVLYTHSSDRQSPSIIWHGTARQNKHPGLLFLNKKNNSPLSL